MEHRRNYSKGYNYKNNKNPIEIEILFSPNGVAGALEDIKYDDYDAAQDLFYETLDTVLHGFKKMLKNKPVLRTSKYEEIIKVMYPNARRFVQGIEVWEKEKDTADEDVKYIYKTTIAAVKKHL